MARGLVIHQSANACPACRTRHFRVALRNGRCGGCQAQRTKRWERFASPAAATSPRCGSPARMSLAVMAKESPRCRVEGVVTPGASACAALRGGIDAAAAEWHRCHGPRGPGRRRGPAGVQNIRIGMVKRKCARFLDRRLREHRRHDRQRQDYYADDFEHGHGLLSPFIDRLQLCRFLETTNCLACRPPKISNGRCSNSCRVPDPASAAGRRMSTAAAARSVPKASAEKTAAHGAADGRSAPAAPWLS